jgi:hypothetical protein
MRVVESKVLAAPVVLDSKANGKLYLSAISLARFEETAGRRTPPWFGSRIAAS